MTLIRITHKVAIGANRNRDVHFGGFGRDYLTLEGVFAQEDLTTITLVNGYSRTRTSDLVKEREEKRERERKKEKDRKRERKRERKTEREREGERRSPL